MRQKKSKLKVRARQLDRPIGATLTVLRKNKRPLYIGGAGNLNED